MRRRILFSVNKNRVLVPVGEPCPFGCRYCYTRNGEVGLTRVKVEDILTPFSRQQMQWLLSINLYVPRS